jgi:hypothetical protein
VVVVQPTGDCPREEDRQVYHHYRSMPGNIQKFQLELLTCYCFSYLCLCMCNVDVNHGWPCVSSLALDLV